MGEIHGSDSEREGRMEEDAKWSMERAHDYLIEGNFGRALSLLEKGGALCPQLKGLPELLAVTQVCYAATWTPCTCPSKTQEQNIPDWYRVLKVDEKADIDAIKKSFRQLALLLHPDKNKHARAEEAFKLVSEAYANLADRNKRTLFNLERMKRRHCKLCLASNKRTKDTQVLPKGFRERLKGENQSSFNSNAFFTSGIHRAEWKVEHEKLRMFRELSQAKVDSLAQILRGRHSKWYEEFGLSRDKFENFFNEGTGSPATTTNNNNNNYSYSYNTTNKNNNNHHHHHNNNDKDKDKDNNNNSYSDKQKLLQQLQRRMQEMNEARKEEGGVNDQGFTSAASKLIENMRGGGKGRSRGGGGRLAMPILESESHLQREIRESPREDADRTYYANTCSTVRSPRPPEVISDECGEVASVIDEFLGKLKVASGKSHQSSAVMDPSIQGASSSEALTSEVCGGSTDFRQSFVSTQQDDRGKQENNNNPYMDKGLDREVSKIERVRFDVCSSHEKQSRERIAESKAGVFEDLFADRRKNANPSLFIQENKGLGRSASFKQELVDGCSTTTTANIDTNEAFLESQKKKSDQLMKTLERLREETRSFATVLQNLKNGIEPESNKGSTYPEKRHISTTSMVAS